jgi:hypothetical protein
MIRPSYLARGVPFAAFVLSFGLLSFGGHRAFGAPKVAVTPIEGDSGGEVRQAVSEALEGNDLVVISKKEVNRAVDKFEDISDMSEGDAKKLAKALEADAVVHGKLAKGDGGKTLKFQLFVNGKKQKGFSVTFNNAKSPKFRRMLHEKMVAKIGSASESADEDDPPAKTKKGKKDKDDDAEVKGKKGKKGKDDEEVKTTAKKGKDAKKAKDGDDEEDPLPKKKGKDKDDDKEAKAAKKGKDKDKDAKEAKADKADKADKEDKEDKTAKADASPKEKDVKGDDDDGDKKAKKKTVAKKGDDDDDGTVTAKAVVEPTEMHGANRIAVRLDAGVSIAKRTLTFTSNLPPETAPKAFNPSPVPGAHFEAELYPLAFSNPKSVASGLGIGIEFDKTLGMKVGTTTEATRAPVSSQNFQVAGQFRFVLGQSVTSPSITAGFGFGKRTFKVDRTAFMDPNALDLPNTDYSFFAPRLAFRIPFAKPIALIGMGEGMLVTNAGEIQQATSYGKAKIIGFSGQAGLDIVLGNRFAVRLVGEFTQIGFTFISPGGSLANGRDGDPTSFDVGGAADKTLGGSATLAVLY